MVYEVLHSVLLNGVRLAFAVLPATPLLGLKRPAASAVKNIVLVHGAFADGSSWLNCPTAGNFAMPISPMRR